ncbi:MAG: PTS IIA-like nitrogen regulatory protein PtsN [Gammaproteobacteria bacterium]|nr:PTS IIA-like nitrogen regulatory protein PtsN [Gammaproteobacteria bacterium]
MKINEILTPSYTVNDAQADTKKAVLDLISKLMAQNLADVEYKQILECLISREKLGTTAIGHGIAIPHGRIKDLFEPIAALIHLQKPVDFDADDNQPVDLLFALLVPEEAEETHLEILAAIALKLSNKKLRNKLRSAKDSTELYQLICSE